MTNNIETTAVNIVKDKLGLADGDVTYISGHSSDILHYAYLKQSHVCSLSTDWKDNIDLISRLEWHSIHQCGREFGTY